MRLYNDRYILHHSRNQPRDISLKLATQGNPPKGYTSAPNESTKGYKGMRSALKGIHLKDKRTKCIHRHERNPLRDKKS